MRAVRRQNGTVIWPHMSSVPGAQLPLGLALDLLDGIELITWNDPTQLPNRLSGNWLCFAQRNEGRPGADPARLSFLRRQESRRAATFLDPCLIAGAVPLSVQPGTLALFSTARLEHKPAVTLLLQSTW